jgi:cytochrome c556
MLAIGRHARRVVVAVVACAGVAAWACSSPKPAAPPPPAAPSAPVMKPVVSVKELMRFTIDPLADNIFDAVTWDISKKGVIATEPRTDEDWEKVKIGAVTLAESVYLLKVPRPFAPQGDVNNSTGPNPPELSPDQIKAKLDKDPVLWDAKIEVLRNVAKEVMEIVDKKDVKALFEASEDLDKACEACHLEYWYPGDRAAVEDDARQRARFEKSARRGAKKK